jgi:hypothetical protein
MNTTHRRRRIAAGALVSSGLAAAAIGLAAHANATGPVGPLNWCPGQHLPQPDVHWNMNSCHSYYYVYAGQGNVGDGSLGGNNSVWEGTNPPVGPAAGRYRTSGARGSRCRTTGPAPTEWRTRSTGT